MSNLNMQIVRSGNEANIELISLIDSKSMTLGEKRNHLKGLANGRYICFIEDDDTVSNKYIQTIIHAITYDADIITFKGNITENKTTQKINLSTVCGNISPDFLFKIPNHLCPVRQSIVKDFDFNSDYFNQYEDYGELLNNFIKNEYHINHFLYLYRTNKSMSQKINKQNTAFRESEGHPFLN